MSISHIKSVTIADGTDSNIVRPSDWNSGHNLFQTFGGNTAGVSTFSGPNLVWAGGNNITLSANGSTVSIVGGAGGAGDGGNVLAVAGSTANSTGTVLFSNAAGVTFGMNAGTITASVKTDYLTTAQPPGAYLTTAAQSDHSHGNPTLALTNLTGTTASNSAGFTLSLSAALGGGAGDGYNSAQFTNATANSTQPIVWAGNSNGSGNVTMGITGSTVTMSAPSGGGGGVGLNTAATNVTWTVNTSGISLNAGAYLTTAQPPGAYLTTADLSQNSSRYAGTVTGITGSIGLTVNTSGVSVSIPAFLTTAQAPGAYLTTARASNDAIGLNSALTANGVSVTANSSGLSLNFPAFLTTAAQSGHSHGNPTLALTNLTGTTASASNGFTLSLSAASPGGGAFAAGASTDANGTTGTVGNQIVFFEGANITLSQSVNGGSASLSIIGAAGGGGAGYTALTYQNRQLAASTTSVPAAATASTAFAINQMWLAPFRLAAPVSASSMIGFMSLSGTVTSAATAQAGLTWDHILYSQNATATNQFDSWWSTRFNATFWNSGTSSYSYSNNLTSGSSAGSNLGTASVMGVRMFTGAIGTTMQTGLWLYGSRISTSSAGYSAAMSRMAPVFDGPALWAAGFVGSATNVTNGYADAGTWTSGTTASPPASVSIAHIAAVSNIAPWFKVGAL